MTKDKIMILFFIKENGITVYEQKNNSFKTIQDCGEDVIEYSDNFMNWFKSSIAYLKDKQELDYLIITDNSVELDFSDFDIVNQSSWNKESIRDFHNSILKSQGLILRNIQKREYYRANVKRHPLEYTVIFCDKNLKEIQEIKPRVELSKIQENENKKENHKPILKSGLKQNTKIKTNNLEEEQDKFDLAKEGNLNIEVNISEYYKKKLAKEEKERSNKRAKF